MMKKSILMILSLMLILGCVPVFANTDDSVMTYGELLQMTGLVQGSSNGLEEDRNLTREELVTILVRMSTNQEEFENFQAPSEPSFSDVPATHWAYQAIEYAKYKQITSGVGENRFGLGENVNYRQAAIFFVRALGYGTEGFYDGDTLEKIQRVHYLNYYGLQKNLDDNLNRGEVFALMAYTLKSYPYGSDNMHRLYEVIRQPEFIDPEEFLMLFNSNRVSLPLDSHVTSNRTSPYENLIEHLEDERLIELVNQNIEDHKAYNKILENVVRGTLEPSSIDEVKAIADEIFYKSVGVMSYGERFYSYVHSIYLSLDEIDGAYNLHVQSSEGMANATIANLEVYQTTRGEDTYFVLKGHQHSFGYSKKIPVLWVLQISEGEVIQTYGNTNFGIGTSQE